MGSKVHSNKTPEFRSALFRWCDVIALGVLPAVFWLLVFETSPPRHAFSWLLKQPALIQCVLSGLAALIIILIQQRFHVRLKRAKHRYFLDLKALLYYPPLHLSVFTGLTLFISMSDAVEIQPLNSNSTLLITVFCFTYGVLAIFKQPKSEKKNVTNKSGQSLDSMSDKEFGEWIETDDPTYPIDLLNRKPYVDRIVKRLTDSTLTKTTRGQIIYGPFGSGKSTLVESIFSELSNHQNEEWISCHFDCWGRTEAPEVLTELLLEEVIDAIGQHIDASAIISIPAEYVAAAYDAHYLFRAASPFFRKRPRSIVLNDVNQILKQNNLRLLLVVENIDRAQDVSLFAGVVGSVLDQVANLDRIRFLFTSDRHPDIAPIASRLADHIEELSLNNTYKIIQEKFIKYCIKQTKPEIILPYRDKAGVIYLNRKSIHDNDFRSLFIAAASFIDNIRDLKIIFRNTIEMWQIHQGEIYVLDIFLYNLYRQSYRLAQKIDKIVFSRNGNEKHDPNAIVDYEMLADRVDESYIQKMAINSPEQSLAILRTYLLCQGAYRDKYTGLNLSNKYGNTYLESLRSGVVTEQRIQPFLHAIVELEELSVAPDNLCTFFSDPWVSRNSDLNELFACYWHDQKNVALNVCIKAVTLTVKIRSLENDSYYRLAHSFISCSGILAPSTRFELLIQPALDILKNNNSYEQALIFTRATTRDIDINLAAITFSYFLSLKFDKEMKVNINTCLADFVYLFRERMTPTTQPEALPHIKHIYESLKFEMNKNNNWLRNYFHEGNSTDDFKLEMIALFELLIPSNGSFNADAEFLDQVKTCPTPK